MSIESLREMLAAELQEIYSAEVQVRRALPRLARLAANPALKDALDDHLHETEGQTLRVEQALAELGYPARGKYCLGMDGVLAETRDLLDQCGGDAVRDSWLVAASRRVAHYEIAAYRTAETHAQLLGEERIAELLDRNLDQENATEVRFASLAEDGVDALALEVDTGRFPSLVRHSTLREEFSQ